MLKNYRVTTGGGEIVYGYYRTLRGARRAAKNASTGGSRITCIEIDLTDSTTPHWVVIDS